MGSFFKYITSLIHIPFDADKISTIGISEVRKIRMTSYIGLVTLLNMTLYAALYSIIDFNLFKPAIILLLIGSLNVLLIFFLNRKGYHQLSKILITSINPFYMTLVVLVIFGKEPEFQTFLLLSAFIPLFLWPLNKKYTIGFFITTIYLIYIVIQFFQFDLSPKVVLPEKLLVYFKITNVFICFLGAALALSFYVYLARNNENNLLKRTNELEKARRNQDLVYSLIAHDLRSPFNSLFGFSQLLNFKFESFSDQEKKKMIEVIYESSGTVNQLLENLLGWTKFQTGSHKASKSHIDLHKLASDAFQIFKNDAEKKRIQLDILISENTFVYADENMISAVIRNLISNAIKFTKIEGIISLSAIEYENLVEFCIQDNGVGIPQKEIDQLFKPEGTYKSKGTSNENGCGLGLKLSGEFIKANNGKIWAESKEQEGSQFYFVLPRN